MKEFKYLSGKHLMSNVYEQSINSMRYWFFEVRPYAQRIKILFKCIAGTNENLKFITASTDAGRNFGILEVVSTGNGATLSIIDLESKKLLDFVNIDYGGKFNEKLFSENVSAFARG